MEEWLLDSKSVKRQSRIAGKTPDMLKGFLGRLNFLVADLKQATPLEQTAHRRANPSFFRELLALRWISIYCR
jgi:hypothetical protein